jgi:hypothetical protein
MDKWRAGFPLRCLARGAGWFLLCRGVNCRGVGPSGSFFLLWCLSGLGALALVSHYVMFTDMAVLVFLLKQKPFWQHLAFGSVYYQYIMQLKKIKKKWQNQNCSLVKIQWPKLRKNNNHTELGDSSLDMIRKYQWTWLCICHFYWIIKSCWRSGKNAQSLM